MTTKVFKHLFDDEDKPRLMIVIHRIDSLKHNKNPRFVAETLDKTRAVSVSSRFLRKVGYEDQK